MPAETSGPRPLVTTSSSSTVQSVMSFDMPAAWNWRRKFTVSEPVSEWKTTSVPALLMSRSTESYCGVLKGM